MVIIVPIIYATGVSWYRDRQTRLGGYILYNIHTVEQNDFSDGGFHKYREWGDLCVGGNIGGVLGQGCT